MGNLTLSVVRKSRKTILKTDDNNNQTTIGVNACNKEFVQINLLLISNCIEAYKNLFSISSPTNDIGPMSSYTPTYAKLSGANISMGYLLAN